MVNMYRVEGKNGGPQGFQEGTDISAGFSQSGTCLQLSICVGSSSVNWASVGTAHQGPPCRNGHRKGGCRRACWNLCRMARIWVGMSKWSEPASAPGGSINSVFTFSFLALQSVIFSFFQGSLCPYFQALHLGPHSSVNTLFPNFSFLVLN